VQRVEPVGLELAPAVVAVEVPVPRREVRVVEVGRIGIGRIVRVEQPRGQDARDANPLLARGICGDDVERRLGCVFLRRYVIWCANCAWLRRAAARLSKLTAVNLR
jgi:hypothetical protein